MARTNYRGDNPDDATFGTEEQIAYARRIAEHLRKQKSGMPSAGQMVLPGTWMYGASNDISNALLGNRYEDTAGQQDYKQSQEVQGNEANLPPTRNQSLLGGLGDLGGSLTGTLKKLWKGEKSSRITTPGKDPDEITTGSIPPVGKDEFPSDATDVTKVPNVIGPEGESIGAPSSNAPGRTPTPGGINRSSFEPEVEKDPTLIRRMASMVKGEVGLGPDVNVVKQRRQLESAYNRSQVREHGLEQGLRTIKYHPQSGYYARDTYNAGGYNGERISDKEMEWFKKNVYEPVMAGSDHGTAFLGSTVTGNASEGTSHFASRRKAQGLYAAGKWDGPEMYVTEKSDADRLAKNPGLLPRYPAQAPATIASGASNPISGKMPLGAGDVSPNAPPPGGPTPPPPGGDTAADPRADELAKGMAPPAGPPPGGLSPMGDRFAQNFGTQPPADNSPPNPNPNPPLLRPLTPGQLDAAVRGVPMSERNKVIEEHRKELKGEDIKNVYGATRAQPGQGGAPNTYTNMPNQATHITIGNMQIPTVPDGRGGLKAVLPGLGDRPLNTIDDWNKLSAELSRSHSDITELGGAQRAHVKQAMDEGNKAFGEMQVLRTMEGTVKAIPEINWGPHSEVWNDVKKTVVDLFPGKTDWARGVAGADTVGKLNTLLASEGIRGISNRGTNLEWESLTRANPSLASSREGTLMLIDLLKQEKQQKIELSHLANSGKHTPQEWLSAKEKYYKDNPIWLNVRNNDGSHDRITTKKIEKEEDLKGLPSGTKFLVPGRDKLGTVP